MDNTTANNQRITRALRVGITGGIGSGKTMVCKVFEEALGIPVFYADTWAKQLILDDPTLHKGIVELFGQEAYTADGEYNRPYIAKIVFSDPAKLAELNALVHPAVELAALNWHEKQAKKGFPYTLKEAALLVESGSYKHLDFLIVVTAPESIRIQRVMERDHIKEDQVRARMRGQLPEADKVKLANFIIKNDGSELLLPQVWAAHQKLMEGI